MTDATALHRDFMKALLTHIPRTVYHDIRRVVTLAWAIVGLESDAACQCDGRF